MIRTLQGCRALFLLLIFVCHFRWEGRADFTFGGDCGVAFFFILSGFVLSIAHGQEIESGKWHGQPFIAKKLLRLLPLHWLCAALFALRIYLHGDPVEADTVLPNLLLLQSWIPVERFYYSLNSPAWFLSDLLFLYLIFRPLYTFLATKRLKTVCSTVAAALAIYALVAAFLPKEQVEPWLYIFPISRVFDFSLGILSYRLWRNLSQRRAPRRLPSLDVAALALLFLTYLLHGWLPERVACQSLFWLFMPAIILLFSADDRTQRPGLISRALQSRPAQWLGSITFEFYLLHVLVMRATVSLLRQLTPTPNFWLSLLLSLALTIIIAAIVKRYFTQNIYFKLKNRVIKI